MSEPTPSAEEPTAAVPATPPPPPPPTAAAPAPAAEPATAAEPVVAAAALPAGSAAPGGTPPPPPPTAAAPASGRPWTGWYSRRVPVLAMIGTLVVGLVLGACGVGAAVAVFGGHDRGTHNFQRGPGGGFGDQNDRFRGDQRGDQRRGGIPGRGPVNPAPSTATPAPSTATPAPSTATPAPSATS